MIYVTTHFFTVLHFLTCFVSLKFFVWTMEHSEERFSGVTGDDGPDSP